MAPSYEDLEDLEDLETLPPLPNTNTSNPAAHAPVKPALDTMVEVDVRLHYQYTTNQSENDDEPKTMKWPVGPHAEKRMGIREFGKLACVQHRVHPLTLEQTKSWLSYCDCEGQMRRIRSDADLKLAILAAPQGGEDRPSITIELVLPKQTAAQAPVHPPDKQLQLRKKLLTRKKDRQNQSKSKTAMLAQWSKMPFGSHQWETWSALTTKLLVETPGLIERVGVCHVIPPRSKHAGTNAYILIPCKCEVTMVSFSAEGRRFAWIGPAKSAGREMDEFNATLQEVLPGGQNQQHCVSMAAGSTSIIAQDMTFLLAVEPDCLMAVRTLFEKDFRELNEWLMHALNTGKTTKLGYSNWIPVCAFPTEEFLPQTETPAEITARKEQERLLAQETQEKQKREKVAEDRRAAAQKQLLEQRRAQQKADAQREAEASVAQQLVVSAPASRVPVCPNATGKAELENKGQNKEKELQKKHADTDNNDVGSKEKASKEEMLSDEETGYENRVAVSVNEMTEALESVNIHQTELKSQHSEYLRESGGESGSLELLEMQVQLQKDRIALGS